ncbi:hypothetical protein [Sphingomonas sp.]|uniref:hypothetical protein n=1 Tax=Sphingomonas sp. TaxID=28214 RepID=UPI0025E64245|nr:hypothetical protein [Sphingomonas sp.]
MIAPAKKGSFEMSARIFQRQFAVFAAALLMSTIAVGAAVGPGVGSGAASARSFITVTYA